MLTKTCPLSSFHPPLSPLPHSQTPSTSTMFPPRSPPLPHRLVKQTQSSKVQPGAVKMVLWRHWMHLSYMHPVTSENQFHCTWLLNNRRWDNKPIIPKKTQQTDLMFSHNPIFALFSSVAIQREQRKNQEQGNIYKDLSVRSSAESVPAPGCTEMWYTQDNDRTH